MRRFVIVGQSASASPTFSTDNLPASSGRLDVLLRCLRAALLVSHGLRADTRVYLVLYGGEHAPRTLRFDGSTARFLRPDERSLAIAIQKVLAEGAAGAKFRETRSGIAVAGAGLDAVLAELGEGMRFVLEEGGRDLREVPEYGPDPAFFVGDHRGFAAELREQLKALSAAPIGVGPLSLHAEDAVTLVCNELDRRAVGQR